MSLTETGAAALLAGALATAQAAAPQPFVYKGLCDASAAVALGPQHFVVADDEINILQIYQRTQAQPVASHDLSSFLGVAADKESDLEGAAAIGARIYWISSHASNSEGKAQQRRYRFFATEIQAGALPSLAPAGQPYVSLLDDLKTAPQLAPYQLAQAAQMPAKSASGLNIEGLSATPDGKLLIGFRAPLRQGRALIVPLTNPAEVVQGRKAVLGAPLELDLGGRGIRSIELIGASYIIVAGPAGADGDFMLYRWSGQQGEAPRTLPDIDLQGLHPEAVFAIPGTGQLQILSDDGSVKTGGLRCKDRPKFAQSFRSLIVTP
ncbi:MAG: DUF3616 domain-containing protein [Pseudomonadota bacterium]